MTDPQLRSSHIAIVGFGPNTRPPEHLWADQAVEKWTLNHGHTIDPRWDRLFEFHTPETVALESRIHTRGVDQADVLRRETTRPIYMRERRDDVPASVRFDIERWTRYFGRGCIKLQERPYCVMAVGFMLGEAIIRLHDYYVTHGPTGGQQVISLYGIELIDDEEYAYQRACCEFFVGYALGVGICVNVPMASAVLSSNGLYEYDSGEVTAVLNWQLTHLGERLDTAKGHFSKATADNADAIARMHTFSGQMQEIEDERKIVAHLLRGGRYS